MASRPRAPEDGYPKHERTKVLPTANGARYELAVRLPSGAKGLLVIQVFTQFDDPLVSIWEIARARQ